MKNRAGAGRLKELVAFDRRVPGHPDGLGGTIDVWTEIRTCRAEFMFMRGSESVDAARLQGRSVFRVRIRKLGTARSLAQNVRMRTVKRGLPEGLDDQDPLPGVRYNVLEVDAISDSKWVFLSVETSEHPI
ncbi:phage head completion protein [Ruegeria sp. TM1040]|uniref:phage head completion protein n=1 Tax=Ruegeria sp. (strain TM1040) TaxID=292414 RepID=UPI0005C6A462